MKATRGVSDMDGNPISMALFVLIKDDFLEAKLL